MRRDAFRVPRHPSSVGLARLRVCRHLAVCGHETGSEAADAALLVVSELVTNAVRHGPVLEREVEIAVTALHDGSCLVEVRDESTTVPHVRPANDGQGEQEESGRGLSLVGALAEAWGVARHRDGRGKTVWALLPSPAPPRATHSEVCALSHADIGTAVR
ncbi:ATP-binding protein [Streptomyces sp. SAS_270]|uniref:ATP-binding protein n=1 Tax=Streptomyces sp. SAS_270 TaxID=3412748 RepID=UPI00403D0E04